jgi:hypothetical protein
MKKHQLLGQRCNPNRDQKSGVLGTRNSKCYIIRMVSHSWTAVMSGRKTEKFKKLARECSKENTEERSRYKYILKSKKQAL